MSKCDVYGGTPTSEYSKILKEVWDILMITDFFDSINRDVGHDTKRLDERLQEIRADAPNMKSDVLSAWLRYTSSWSAELPTWKPLLDDVYALMKQRHPDEDIEHGILIGLLHKD